VDPGHVDDAVARDGGAVRQRDGALAGDGAVVGKHGVGAAEGQRHPGGDVDGAQVADVAGDRQAVVDVDDAGGAVVHGAVDDPAAAATAGIQRLDGAVVGQRAAAGDRQGGAIGAAGVQVV